MICKFSDESLKQIKWSYQPNVELLLRQLYSFIIAILFYKNRLNLTEENKKQVPCRQHSIMPLIKYQYPKIWIIPKGLFIIYWGTGPVFRRTGQGLFLMLPSTGHKDFLCFYGTGHEFFLGKKSLKLYL